ncbi:endonuclease [uncultured Winogradskyella sp.]|uniref:endonuclease n=1 Tax=uncultured Winogradskyella sp. TaxID=395353 RepID=UPI0030D9740A|tara:strand:- start:8623 stop:10413 length:1791 start_codon:yes stop_codon:yes gene_type:complete
MKNFYFLILAIITTSISFAQIPSNYYDSANGLTGFALKTQLKVIITNGHSDQGYSALYSGYTTTHSDNIAQSGYENDNTILLYYTENPNGTDPYVFNHGSNQCGNYNAESICYNREHLIPQSSFSGASPMKNDIHHVIPSDGYANGQRGSFPFGTVGSASWTSLNGSKKGNSNVVGYSGTVFEPIDEFKGDIARAVLYFATRYEDTVDDYTGFNMFNGTEDQALFPWAIDLLLDWHYNVDPVDQREIDRNDAAYNFQGNANPFVDHPEYANIIWNPTPDTEDPTNPTNLVASNPTDNSIDLNWTASTDNIAVVSYDIYINTIYTYNTSSTSFTATGLTSATNYCFTIKAKDAAGNESGLSNQDCEVTTDNGAGGSDCLAETFENIGTSSGSYSNVSWTGDDGGTWNATDSRTDQTLNTRSITVRNGVVTLPVTSGGIGTLTVTTQRVFSGSSGTFNLNVNGNFVSTIDYSDTAETITIPNINVENNISIVIDGNSSASNRVKFDDLSYTCFTTLSVDEFNTSSIKIHPNPVKNNLTIDLKLDIDTKIEIYDILGKRVYRSTLNNTSIINLQSLKTGIYIVKITQNNATITKRLIKQ